MLLHVNTNKKTLVLRDEGLTLRGTTLLACARRKPLRIALSGETRPGLLHSPRLPVPDWDTRRVRPLCSAGHLAGLTPLSPGSLADGLLLLIWHINILEDLFNQARESYIVKFPVPDDNFPLSGPRGIRTPGLLNAIEARSQLRYGPFITIWLTSTVAGWARSPA